MRKTIISISIDPDVLYKLDKRRNSIPRSTFVEDLIQRMLGIQEEVDDVAYR